MGESWFTCDNCDEAGSDYHAHQFCENGHDFCFRCVEDVNFDARKPLEVKFKLENPDAEEDDIDEWVEEALCDGLPEELCPVCEYVRYKKKREADKQEELKNWVAVPVELFKELALAFYQLKDVASTDTGNFPTNPKGFEADIDELVENCHSSLLKLLEE